MDENLVGYLLNALDADEQRQTECYLRENADARRKLELLRSALAPLAADRESIEPPPGLVERTMARVAATLGRKPRIRVPLATDQPTYPAPRWRRIDVLVACSILILFGGLSASGLIRVHDYRNRIACQNNLREYNGGLVQYADTHGGAYPFIEAHQHADAFAPMLMQSGEMTATPNCPTVAGAAGPVYAYTLGYRDAAGQLHGLRRGMLPDVGDRMPIMADRPQPLPHSGGFNVLFAGGYVVFSTTPNIGINLDDIYHNDFFEQAAGAHVRDSALGSGDTTP